MADEIPPALTSEEWADYRSETPLAQKGMRVDERRDVARMALYNDALPDDSPHKLRQAHVNALRRAARELDQALYDVGAIEVRVVADLLAALLPPEGA